MPYVIAAPCIDDIDKSCMEGSPVGTPGGAHKTGPIGVDTSMAEY
jgi:hypothetical protein